jgi:hypothetical protein
LDATHQYRRYVALGSAQSAPLVVGEANAPRAVCRAEDPILLHQLPARDTPRMVFTQPRLDLRAARPPNRGELGGLTGADAHCQALATAAGRGNVTWHAYLSTQGPDAVNAREACTMAAIASRAGEPRSCPRELPRRLRVATPLIDHHEATKPKPLRPPNLADRLRIS